MKRWNIPSSVFPSKIFFEQLSFALQGSKQDIEAEMEVKRGNIFFYRQLFGWIPGRNALQSAERCLERCHRIYRLTKTCDQTIFHKVVASRFCCQQFICKCLWYAPSNDWCFARQRHKGATDGECPKDSPRPQWFWKPIIQTAGSLQW